MLDRIHSLQGRGVTWEYPGGNALIFSVTLAQLGPPACVLTQVGDDAIGSAIERLLESRRVDTSLLATTNAAPTKICKIQLDKHGEWHWSASEPEDFPHLPQETPSLRSFDYLHVAGLNSLLRTSPRALRRLVDEARGYDLRISFDLNRVTPGQPDLVHDLIGAEDILFCSQAELADVAGVDPSNLTGHRVIRELPWRHLVVTLGRGGAIIRWEDRAYRAYCTEPPRAINTLGAGDIFAATFLAAQIRGDSLQLSAQQAMTAATFSITQTNWDSLPIFEELLHGNDARFPLSFRQI